MKIAVAKEVNLGELRVAIVPEIVAEYTKLGFEILLEAGLGEEASFKDEQFIAAGAKIVKNDDLHDADIVLTVAGLDFKELGNYKKNALLVGLLASVDKKFIDKATQNNLSVFGLELMPRITRAQSMDVLSSQSNLTGYKAVIDGVAEFGKVVPMMMTAAGTIKPAKILVLGAGVAGLQAIATAKRLGAIVTAFDVRREVKEQVQSLGANFVAVEEDNNTQNTAPSVYAKEMSEEYKQKQSILIAREVAKNDIVITTALIPGKPAPLLVTEDMVKSMPEGSVIVDLAATSGGNCAVSQRNEIIIKHGVKIIAYENFAARIAYDASRLYARNIFNFIKLLVSNEQKNINIDLNDEIIKSCLITHHGEIVHPRFSEVK